MGFRRPTVALILFALISAGMGCAKFVGRAPEDVARQFFEHAVDGNYAAALEVTAPMMAGLAKHYHPTAPDAWREYLDAITKNGAVDRIDSKLLYDFGKSATAEVNLTFKDGTKSKQRLELARDDLSWKVWLVRQR